MRYLDLANLVFFSTLLVAIICGYDAPRLTQGVACFFAIAFFVNELSVSWKGGRS